MLDYKNLCLNSGTFAKVLADQRAGRLSSTYLLVNQDMDFCFEFAKLLSKLIIKGNKEDHIFNDKMEKNIHPDIKVYGLDKKINADMASEIVSDVYVMPYEEDRKVYILYNASDMNEEAQNKLLKTLEEPPVSSFFILCAKTEKTLLQTVISRSKKFIIEDPNTDDIENLLISAGVMQATAKIASIACSGNAANAYKIAGNANFIKLYDNIFDMFKNMNSSKDVLRFVTLFSVKDFSVNEFLNLVEKIAMDIVYELSSSTELITNKHKLSELSLISKGWTSSAIAKILKECFAFRESLYYNVSITPALDEFLLKFVEVKVKCKR